MLDFSLKFNLKASVAFLLLPLNVVFNIDTWMVLVSNQQLSLSFFNHKTPHFLLKQSLELLSP